MRGCKAYPCFGKQMKPYSYHHINLDLFANPNLGTSHASAMLYNFHILPFRLRSSCWMLLASWNVPIFPISHRFFTIFQPSASHLGGSGGLHRHHRHLEAPQLLVETDVLGPLHVRHGRQLPAGAGEDVGEAPAKEPTISWLEVNNL